MGSEEGVDEDEGVEEGDEGEEEAQVVQGCSQGSACARKGSVQAVDGCQGQGNSTITWKE